MSGETDENVGGMPGGDSSNREQLDDSGDDEKHGRLLGLVGDGSGYRKLTSRFAVARKRATTAYEGRTGLFSVMLYFLAGLVALGSAFKSTEDNCKGDQPGTIVLFFIFAGAVALAMWAQITSADTSLPLLLLAALTCFAVFYSGRLFVECTDGSLDEDRGMIFASSLSHVLLGMANVATARALFGIGATGVVMISLELTHLIVMMITGVHPFHSWSRNTSSNCPASKECLMKEKDPAKLKGWFKHFFRNQDDKGVSCDRRTKESAGKAIMGSLVTDNGMPHEYFPLKETLNSKYDKKSK